MSNRGVNKIGLALGGGGAKGAYQVGVIKALFEYDLISQISVLSGTSIGSINGLMVTAGFTIDEIEYAWSLFNNQTVYGKPLGVILSRKDGLFSLEKMSHKLEPLLDLNKLKNSPIQGYAILSKGKLPNPIELFKMRNQQTFAMEGFTKEAFLLNTADNPFDVVLASSAIPLVFGVKVVGGTEYYDGGIVDNIPYSTLIDHGCNILLTIALDEYFYIDEVSKEVALIDFSPAIDFGPFPRSSLDFNQNLVISRIKLGYEHTILFLQYLRENNYLTKNNKFKVKKGTRLILKEFINKLNEQK